MGKHLKYLKYVLRHKWFVYQAGRELRVGRFQLLLHDWHKFLPDEWSPYVRKFYGPNYPTNDDANMTFGLYTGPTKESIARDFDVAWLRHQHRAPHHWQHHVLPEDGGGTKVLEMPDKYRREMVADWTGMGRAFGEPDAPRGWYLKNREKMQLHPETRAWVEHQLEVTAGAIKARKK